MSSSRLLSDMRLLKAHIAVLLVAVVSVSALGWLLLSAIERSIIKVYAESTAGAATSAVSEAMSSLPSLPEGKSDTLTPGDRSSLDEAMSASILSENVLRIKVWSRDGTVLFSSDPALIGRRFGVKRLLADAIGGSTNWSITRLSSPENVSDRERFGRLLEIYSPLKGDQGTPGEPAAFELYVSMVPVEKEIDAVKMKMLFGLIATLALILMTSLIASRLLGEAPSTALISTQPPEEEKDAVARSALTELLRAETLRATRYGRTLSVVLIDRSPSAADTEALIAIDEEMLRESDCARPYPGGGILIVLPETGPDAAKDIASRLVAKAAREGSANKANLLRAGVADIPGCAQEYRSLLGAAESALEMAGQTPGDEVVYYGDQVSEG